MDFDVIVVGCGVAGIAAAKKLSTHGYKAAIIEWNEIGGAVINHGSTSKKIFLAAEEAKQAVEHLEGHGFDIPPHINWSELSNYKSTIVSGLVENLEKELENANITVLKGQAKFIDDHTVVIGEQQLQAAKFILATGARPRKLTPEGAEHFLYSTDFLNLEDMPKHIAIVGAGIIAFAFAGIANAAGTVVEVIQHDDRALAAFDQELVQELIQILEHRGVHFHFNQTVTKLSTAGENQISISCNNGFETTVNKVFSVVGRIPNTEYLDLEKINVSFDAHGIAVDQHLQTTSPHIFAVGDCNDTSVPKLANYAIYQGNYVAEYLIAQDEDRTIMPIQYPIPSMSVFSNPKLALAGISVVEALKNPDVYEIVTVDMSNWLTYRRANDTVSKAKLVIEKNNNRIVGITSLSDQADYLINYMTILISEGITKDMIDRYIFAYPTMATDLPSLFPK